MVPRPQDKRKVIYYRDPDFADFEVDEEFQKLWRSVAVDGLDERKIDEHLERRGIRSMQEGAGGARRPSMQKRGGGKKKPARRRQTAPKDNEHLKDVLENYDEMTAEKGPGGDKGSGGDKKK